MTFFRLFLFRSILFLWRCTKFFSSLSRWIRANKWWTVQKTSQVTENGIWLAMNQHKWFRWKCESIKRKQGAPAFPFSSVYPSCFFNLSILFIGASHSICVCVYFFGKIHRDFMEWMQIQCFSWTIIKSERCSAQLRDGFFCANVLCVFFFVHFRLSLCGRLYAVECVVCRLCAEINLINLKPRASYNVIVNWIQYFWGISKALFCVCLRAYCVYGINILCQGVDCMHTQTHTPSQSVTFIDRAQLYLQRYHHFLC